jgi:hypothetical protein
MFRALLHKLNPRYELPSRKHFMDVVIPKLYQATRDSVQQVLTSMEYYSTTTDIWTSRNMMSYMSVTVHVSSLCYLTFSYKISSAYSCTLRLGTQTIH